MARSDAEVAVLRIRNESYTQGQIDLSDGLRLGLATGQWTIEQLLDYADLHIRERSGG